MDEWCFIGVGSREQRGGAAFSNQWAAKPHIKSHSYFPFRLPSSDSPLQTGDFASMVLFLSTALQNARRPLYFRRRTARIHDTKKELPVTGEFLFLLCPYFTS